MLGYAEILELKGPRVSSLAYSTDWTTIRLSDKRHQRPICDESKLEAEETKEVALEPFLKLRSSSDLSNSPEC